MINADFAAPVLLLGMILSLGAILFSAYTVYVDPKSDPEYKMRMYVFYAALVIVDAVIGVAFWISAQNGG